MIRALIVPIAGVAGFLIVHFLFPIIGFWFIPVAIMTGLAIGYFGSELLYRLGVR